ncbi:MAG: knotted carbamoyltransferase YgeW [Myxococcales bacterium]|nr:knotted carbamoyltransferase YgeW [Myxococcales bacterium]
MDVLTRHLEALSSDFVGYTNSDLLQTWDMSDAQLSSTVRAARLLKELHRLGLSGKIFDTGLAVSIFRDHSTRTRFSFASAVTMLGLALSELDEEKSQIAHGETVRETATMISFLTEAIGIRDDIFLGEGHTYMAEFADALQESFDAGVLPQRPTVVNLQSDRDHPTQALSDLCHVLDHFDCDVSGLRGKKLTMSWAYSPSYGKPLSVPQGVIGLFTRYGMDVTLAYPEGYTLIPEIEKLSEHQAVQSGGSFRIVHDMREAFRGADVVYPKSWAPMWVMEKRTELLRAGDKSALRELEQSCLEENRTHVDWECNESMMAETRDGTALYMHCLPADITGVSCQRGEVAAETFEKARLDTYREASFKPFVIAAMIALARFDDPQRILERIVAEKRPRTRF